MVVSIGLGIAEQVTNIAKRAGREILKIYETDFTATIKSDHSPVTEADQIAEELIIRAIREGVTSKWPIIAEESFSRGSKPNLNNTPFWLIDPLDGTKEFINRNGEFTVNIALIENEDPILGVVHAPTKNITYVGFKDGAFIQTGDQNGEIITVRTPPKKGLTAILSRSHSSAGSFEHLKKYRIANTINAGSSIKFCKIADGTADIYPRFSPTMEWDTAAGHAILKFAGGNIFTADGELLKYGKSNFKNPDFIALSPKCGSFKIEELK